MSGRAPYPATERVFGRFAVATLPITSAMTSGGHTPDDLRIAEGDGHPLGLIGVGTLTGCLPHDVVTVPLYEVL